MKLLNSVIIILINKNELEQIISIRLIKFILFITIELNYFIKKTK